jgi:LysM repeat protein
VAIVLAVVLLTSAIYLGSPAIVDWMRHMGAGAGAANPSPPTPPPTLTPSSPTPAPTATRTPTATPSPSPTPTPAATPQVHVVVRGENLRTIAARYGVTVAAIQKANRITNLGLIYVGQHLVIPPR